MVFPEDKRTVAQDVLRAELRRILHSEAVDRNRLLQQKLDKSEREKQHLRELLDQQRRTLSLALDVINALVSRSKKPQTDLLKTLGVDPNSFGELTLERREEIYGSLRRVAQIVHPNAHPTEPTLVQTMLNVVAHPVTGALNKWRELGKSRP